MKGFTLIELLIVIGASIAIAALTIPVGVNFYTTQVLDETTSDALALFRRAREQAVFQKNDSAFGIKVFSGSYTIFQGSSYASRVQGEDENFTVAAGVTMGGIDEIVFAKRMGIPSTTGTVTITSGSNTRSLGINTQGKIERQ
jgi:type II secretory pathway pseudopilin PulG